MESSFEETELSPDTPFGDVFVDKFKNNASHLMRQNVAMQSPLGKNSVFYENRCGAFDSVPIFYLVQQNKFIEDLANNRKDETFFFNCEEFIYDLGDLSSFALDKLNDAKDDLANKIEDFLSNIPSYKAKKNYNFRESEPPGIEENEFGVFSYSFIDANNSQRTSFYLPFLNSRVCTLSPNLSYILDLRKGEARSYFYINFFYSGTEKFRKIAIDTEPKHDFRIENKYRAITLIFDNSDAFVHAWKKLNGEGDIVTNLNAKFDEIYKTLNSISELKWFHENAPIRQTNSGENQMYWDDLEKLLRYDRDGTFSWFKDSSNAILNIVRKISLSQNGMTFLYDQFNQDNTCYDIYEHMSGSSEYKGETRENKTFFCSLIMALCEANAPSVIRNGPNAKNARDRTDITFKLTKGFRVDSNIAWEDDYPGKFNLDKQFQKWTVEYGQYEAYETSYWYTYASYVLHPMDMVMVEIYDENGQPIQVALPAIYVKDIAYHAEWERTMMAIRIAIDLLILIIPFGTAVTAIQMFFKVVMIVDKVIAGVDIFVNAFREDIAKWPFGEEILKAWDKLYHIVGLTTGIIFAPAGLIAISKVLNLGGRIILEGSKRGVIAAGYPSAVFFIDSLENTMRMSPYLRTLVAGKFRILLNLTELNINAVAYKKINILRDQGAIVVEKAVLENGKYVRSHVLTYEQSILAEGKTLPELEKNVSKFFDKGGKLLMKELEAVSGLGKFDEFITVGGKVKHAGNKKELFDSFNDITKIPSRYSTNENRFNALATDNATGVNIINIKTNREAMAGLEAERQGLINGPIVREPTGDFEFIDVKGNYWDVKTPTGKFFNLKSVGNSVKDQLIVPNVTVLLDCTYITDAQLINLREWLSANLSTQQLEKVIEVNVNLF